MALNLKAGQRAQRKLLITVAEWAPTLGGEKTAREILGTRVEDSSIEFNPDVETVTDILGITYSDVNKTEPQQDMDAFIIGGSELYAYLTEAALRNDIDAYNNVFDLYIITAFIGTEEDGFYAVKHENCSIIPQSMGGDSYTSLPIEIHFSNHITEGTVDTLEKTFEFTPKTKA